MREYNSPFGAKLEDTTFNDSFYKLLNDEYVLSIKGQVEAWCEAYDPELSTGFFLVSPEAGRCKTSLMACTYNYFKNKGVRIDCTNMSEFMYFYRYDSDGFRHITESPFLLFDDIGVDFFTGFKGDEMNSVLYDLINYRYNNSLTTCFSSNYVFDDLIDAKKIIKQTVDRIKGMTAGNWFLVKGTSVRERSDIRKIEIEAKKQREEKEAKLVEVIEELNPEDLQKRAETIEKARAFLRRIGRGEAV